LPNSRNNHIFLDFTQNQINSPETVDTISFKTYSAKPSDIDKKWVLIDATDQPVGRLGTRIATILRGKNKPGFTPHMDTGDNVIVINAEKVTLSGKKMTDKEYFRHTGYPGGVKTITPAELLEKHPTRILEYAVKGMLPKNKLGRQLFRNLRVYAGPVHPHIGQKPEPINL
jgi:large subunit ribosomal protein L13